VINPGTYNITCPQGATFDRTFTVSIGGVAMNLSGYTAAMQVRETYDSATPLISLTNGSGITLGGTAGTIGVVVSSTAMEAVADGFYSYDLEITSGGGVKDRILQGKFVVTPEVTR
jgi:carbon monoxide dehydrogenase subunit G